MKIKDLKKYINMYADDVDVIVKQPSGNTYEIEEKKMAFQILTDEKREVCKLHIK